MDPSTPDDSLALVASAAADLARACRSEPLVPAAVLPTLRTD